ncbi:MAG: hypothetical protein FJ087_00350 [Deltaproteobacteria bacterium]|nr:hypothetical protein [Deltaproteobacteria bacterium]
MAEDEARSVLFDDLRAALADFGRANADVERAIAERRRQATLAQLLLGILDMQIGPEAARSHLERLGLAGLVDALHAAAARRAGEGHPAEEPRVRAPSSRATVRASAPRKAPRTPRASAPTPPGAFPKRTPVRMLGGTYRDWLGHIRRVRVRDGVISYEVEINGPDGRRARTDVGPRSLGSKWQVLTPGAMPAGTAPGTSARAAPARRVRRGRDGMLVPVGNGVAGGTAAAPGAGITPPGALPRRTEVRMLAGRYQGWTGLIVSIVARGTAITYDVTLAGPDGSKAHTRVGQGTRGTSWDTTSAPVVQAAPVPVSVRAPIRRPAARTPPAQDVTASAPVPPPVAPAAPLPVNGVLAKGTPVRMLAGMYLGYSGVISSVQSKATHGVIDALYTLALTGQNDEKARTTVKHSSLGRVWVRA